MANPVNDVTSASRSTCSSLARNSVQPRPSAPQRARHRGDIRDISASTALPAPGIPADRRNPAQRKSRPVMPCDASRTRSPNFTAISVRPAPGPDAAGVHDEAHEDQPVGLPVELHRQLSGRRIRRSPRRVSVTRPRVTPRYFTGAPISNPCTDSRKYVSNTLPRLNSLPAKNQTMPITSAQAAQHQQPDAQKDAASLVHAQISFMHPSRSCARPVHLLRSCTCLHGFAVEERAHLGMCGLVAAAPADRPSAITPPASG